MGASKLAAETELEINQAQDFITKYFEEFPESKLSHKRQFNSPKLGTTLLSQDVVEP